MTMKNNFEPGECLVDVHVLIDLNGSRMTVCYPFTTVTATFRYYNFSYSRRAARSLTFSSRAPRCAPAA